MDLNHSKLARSIRAVTYFYVQKFVNVEGDSIAVYRRVVINGAIVLHVCADSECHILCL